MSGIACVARRDGSEVERAVLDGLVEGLEHRGPDGSGVQVAGPVGIGHQLLCTTPEARNETLPASRGGLAITADARIDNRPELISILDVDDRNHLTDSDLLLAAYDRWGVECPDKLVGAFAFVIWDEPNERLFCARDHVGIKPLYYAESMGRLAIASEVGALLGVPGVERGVNERRIGNYLVHIYENDRNTFFDDISRLRPGHWMVLTDEGVKQRRYWSPADVDPLPPAPREVYQREFRTIFERAIADRLRSVGPVGSMLSGGIDSSSIVCAAESLRDSEEALHTFSAVFETVTECSEREYIDAVLDEGEFEAHFVYGDRRGPLDEIDHKLDVTAQPFYPSLFMLMWQIYEAVSEADINSVLHGYGGDQTMGSNVEGYLRGLVGRGQFLTFWREYRAFRRRFSWVSNRDALWNAVVAPLFPRWVRRLRHRKHDGAHFIDNATMPLNIEFARNSGLGERLAERAVRKPPNSQRALRRASLESGEPVVNLELNDVAAASLGVEPRFPYLDRRVIEFALALPPGHTVRHGLDRTIVRDSLADVLPDDVRCRKYKTEFTPNVTYGLKTYNLKKAKRQLFDNNDTNPQVAKYIDVDELEKTVEGIHGENDFHYSRNIINAVTLERWLETCA